MASIGIQSIHCYHFKLPLAHPFFVRSEQIKNREGYIVHIISDRGDMGFGEVSPLPGISLELFNKAVYQSEILVRDLKGAKAPLELPLLLKWLSERIPESAFCPSVRFGFESAILNMVATANSQSLCDLLKPGASRDVFSAGLLQGAPADIVRQARFLHAKGYTTFKLKVGSRNIPLDVQKVEEVRRVIGPEAKLRLDVNRAWRLEEAVIFAQSIGKDRIEYIEEPVLDHAHLEAFVRRTDMPVALDETVADRSLDEFEGRIGVGFVVARPVQMGGITKFLSFLERANKIGLGVVVTSAFESAVGMTVLANLAALTQVIANLGTANWFNDDLLLRPVVVDAGRVPAERLTLETKFFHPALIKQLNPT